MDIQQVYGGPCDLILVVSDGKEFKAHRNVLSEASPFFDKLVNCDMKEKKEGVVRLEMFTDAQMADVLEFIYNGDIQIFTREDAENLFVAGDYLLLAKLKSIAAEFLAKALSTFNCVSTFHIANMYFCEKLICSTRKFILSNFTAVAATEDFMNLTSHELEEWIASDEIVISAEEEVFTIILRWINCTRSERNVEFGKLFRHVRLNFIARDFLLSDVETNDLVRETKECFDSVTEALTRLDDACGCLAPRPESRPRKSLEICGIVMTGKAAFCTFFYVPEKDQFYRLHKRDQPKSLPKHAHAISCRGKLFLVTEDIISTQVYDPSFNRWSPAPWTKFGTHLKMIPGLQILTAVLVVGNEVCFVVEERGEDLTWLWRFNLDLNSVIAPTHPVDKKSVCAVAWGRHIYIIGGSKDLEALRQCSRFDTMENKWQEVSGLPYGRYGAHGVGTKEKIYIAGGSDEWSEPVFSCEVHNVFSNEWSLIGSLSCPSVRGMVVCNELLYVVSASMVPYIQFLKLEIECYDYEKDEWTVKKSIYCNADVAIKGKASSFSFFKGDLDKLKPFHETGLNFTSGDTGSMFTDHHYNWDHILEYY
ncbi:kelch-like protein diablo [Orbicella faveolata]|uniref:kelch-like protein diablo n=1 Tax=Orbicella faveolata TaxID=48498 RepID=UPI0009E583E0|nr:kelch-like protein diablo [Orbicella faveolata]